jgi:hypothetical protein
MLLDSYRFISPMSARPDETGRGRHQVAAGYGEQVRLREFRRQYSARLALENRDSAGRLRSALDLSERAVLPDDHCAICQGCDRTPRRSRIVTNTAPTKKSNCRALRR